jgi:hypothetical protein
MIATIENIRKVTPMKGCDNIEKVSVGNTIAVVTKGLFTKGDRCVFVHQGAVFPHWGKVLIGRTKEGIWLRRSKYVVEAVKIKGVVSNGLVLHESVITAFEPMIIAGAIPVGSEVGHILGLASIKISAPLEV